MSGGQKQLGKEVEEIRRRADAVQILGCRGLVVWGSVVGRGLRKQRNSISGQWDDGVTVWRPGVQVRGRDLSVCLLFILDKRSLAGLALSPPAYP